MKLLLPELQRQLLVAAGGRHRDEGELPAPGSSRPRLSLALAAVAIAAAIILFLLASGIATDSPPSAAQALERAAQAAQRGLATPSLRPGEYWYTRSIDADTTGFDLYGRPALLQSRETVESWESADGPGRERQSTDGVPRLFATASERARFQGREAQAPKPVPRDDLISSSGGFRSGLGLLSYPQVLALPTAAEAMLARIRAAALRSRASLRRTAPESPLAQQSLAQFELDAAEGALTDLPLTAGSRAAVFRAMEDIGGVGYLASVRDPLGRVGAALTTQETIPGFIDGQAALAGPRRVSNELIFDPRTGVLLAQQRVLDRAIPSVGLPAGYPIQYTAYEASGNVSSVEQRFVARPGGEVLAPAPSASSCSSSGPPAPASISAPIPKVLLDEFSVLRRPATGADRLPPDMTGLLDVSSIIESSVRLLRTGPNGARDYMLAGYRRMGFTLPARRCLPGVSRAQYQRLVEQRKAALAAPPKAVVCVLDVGGNLEFGCLSPAEIDSIDYDTSDYGRPPATVTGIVPDGVSEIRASYPDGRHVDVPVQHNLVVYRVGLAAPNATPERVEWLGSSGRAIRRIARP